VNRTLDAWGRTLFHGEDVAELLMQGYDTTDLLIMPDAVVERYNEMCRRHNKDVHMISPIAVPTCDPTAETGERQTRWSIPQSYRDLDVQALLLGRCQQPAEIARVTMEMALFERKGLLPVLRLMCFLVDLWRAADVVWGVGRGSSVASYCLFLIGIHKIDALHYKLDITEFLRDEPV
jgi:DNA polymerase III alpha subunit